MSKNETLEDFLKRGGKVKKLKEGKTAVSKQVKTKIKKANTKLRNKVKNRILEFAKGLEADLPKSEVWFRSYFEVHAKLHTDVYNRVLKSKYIPDVINFKYSYIIEIDGSIHNDPKQIEKDIKKNAYYKKLKFHVFRVKAYSIDSYLECVEFISKIRGFPPRQEFFDFKLDFEKSNKLL